MWNLALDLIINCLENLGRGIKSSLGESIQNSIRSEIVVLKSVVATKRDKKIRGDGYRMMMGYEYGA